MDGLEGDGIQDEEVIYFSDVDSSSSDGDSELGDEERRKLLLWLELLLLLGRALAMYIEIIECFQPIEMTRGSQSTVIHHMPVQDQLSRSIQNPPHFKELTNFQVDEFHEFCSAVCPVVVAHARCTGLGHKLPGRPYKLTPEQRVLSFVMYMKHDNVIYLDASIWNWARPFEIPLHKKWFQGRKKMYCMNSTVVVDHDGLFKFVDGGYPGSYHDVSILKHSWVDGNWRDLFVNREGYCEYLLGDSSYKGMERYVMRGFSRVEIRVMNLPPGPVREFNQMHSGYRVAVEWGIGGLKQKWRRMLKRFHISRQKFATSFRVAAIMTNFIHRRRRDMRARTVGPGQPGLENRGWAGDY